MRTVELLALAEMINVGANIESPACTLGLVLLIFLVPLNYA